MLSPSPPTSSNNIFTVPKVNVGPVVDRIHPLAPSSSSTVLWETPAVWTSPPCCSLMVLSWALRSRNCSDSTTTVLMMSGWTWTSSWTCYTTSAPPPVKVSRHSMATQQHICVSAGGWYLRMMFISFYRGCPNLPPWIRWNCGPQRPDPVRR